ncbi:uncharacterized protein LOC112167791 isoform X2 [Rosa chinensis]|uniref:uncharacterized protein LOC112167791 isoform X2 n=1 Tax=Rosa chinensis TaxID=74649 RepID=UPI000D08A666|nr:uncharacterized protein LOC112167791 isoform X2 [Rosa chinensis]
MWSLRIWDFWKGGALESVSREMGNGNRMNDDDGNAAMLNRISVEKKLWTRACAHGFGQMIESRERTRMWTSTPYPGFEHVVGECTEEAHGPAWRILL